MSRMRSGRSRSILSKAQATSSGLSTRPTRSDSSLDVSSLWLALPSSASATASEGTACRRPPRFSPRSSSCTQQHSPSGCSHPAPCCSLGPNPFRHYGAPHPLLKRLRSFLRAPTSPGPPPRCKALPHGPSFPPRVPSPPTHHDLAGVPVLKVLQHHGLHVLLQLVLLQLGHHGGVDRVPLRGRMGSSGEAPAVMAAG